MFAMKAPTPLLVEDFINAMLVSFKTSSSKL
jgi:hypothetical protein